MSRTANTVSAWPVVPWDVPPMSQAPAGSRPAAARPAGQESVLQPTLGVQQHDAGCSSNHSGRALRVRCSCVEESQTNVVIAVSHDMRARVLQFRRRTSREVDVRSCAAARRPGMARLACHRWHAVVPSCGQTRTARRKCYCSLPLGCVVKMSVCSLAVSHRFRTELTPGSNPATGSFFKGPFSTAVLLFWWVYRPNKG